MTFLLQASYYFFLGLILEEQQVPDWRESRSAMGTTFPSPMASVIGPVWGGGQAEMRGTISNYLEIWM